jgi:hypothetical protein
MWRELKLTYLKLDSLKGKTLEQANGMLLNYINGKSDVDDWQNHSHEQQAAILHAVEQLEKGHGRSHNEVMSEMRNRFVND